MSVLSTQNITIRFGGVTAVEDLSLEVNKGEIVALIGPNGAGKTTAFNIITGVYTPSSGTVHFDPADSGSESDITGKRPDIIARMGMARTFQNIRLFGGLSVFDNVITAKHSHFKADFLSAALRLPHARREEQRIREESHKLLTILGLESVADETASSLPYGKQRRLEIARALATQPKLLLLDEPAAGMNPQETAELTDFIYRIKDEFDLTVFMIEHHMDLVMKISDRIYVLDFGQMIATGTPDQIQNNDRVIQAYLGVEADAEN